MRRNDAKKLLTEEYQKAKQVELQRIQREKELIQKEAERNGIQVKIAASSPEKEKLNLLNKKEKEEYVKQTKHQADLLVEKKQRDQFEEDLQKKNGSLDQNKSNSNAPSVKKTEFKSDLSDIESNLGDSRAAKDKEDLIKKKKDIEAKLKTLREQEDKLEMSMGLRSSRKLDYSNLDLSHVSDENFDFDREMARATVKKNDKHTDSGAALTKVTEKEDPSGKEKQRDQSSMKTDEQPATQKEPTTAQVGSFD